MTGQHSRLEGFGFFFLARLSVFITTVQQEIVPHVFECYTASSAGIGRLLILTRTVLRIVTGLWYWLLLLLLLLLLCCQLSFVGFC